MLAVSHDALDSTFHAAFVSTVNLKLSPSESSSMLSGPLIFRDRTAPDHDCEIRISFFSVADSSVTDDFLESPVSFAETVMVTLSSSSVVLIQD